MDSEKQSLMRKKVVQYLIGAGVTATTIAVAIKVANKYKDRRFAKHLQELHDIKMGKNLGDLEVKYQEVLKMARTATQITKAMEIMNINSLSELLEKVIKDSPSYIKLPKPTYEELKKANINIRQFLTQRYKYIKISKSSVILHNDSNHEKSSKLLFDEIKGRTLEIEDENYEKNKNNDEEVKNDLSEDEEDLSEDDSKSNFDDDYI